MADEVPKTLKDFPGGDQIEWTLIRMANVLTELYAETAKLPMQEGAQATADIQEKLGKLQEQVGEIKEGVEELTEQVEGHDDKEHILIIEQKLAELEETKQNLNTQVSEFESAVNSHAGNHNVPDAEKQRLLELYMAITPLIDRTNAELKEIEAHIKKLSPDATAMFTQQLKPKHDEVWKYYIEVNKRLVEAYEKFGEFAI